MIERSRSFWEPTKLALSFFFFIPDVYHIAPFCPRSQTSFYLGAYIDNTDILSPSLISLHHASFLRVNIFSILEWLALFPLRRLLAIHGALFLRMSASGLKPTASSPCYLKNSKLRTFSCFQERINSRPVNHRSQISEFYDTSQNPKL